LDSHQVATIEALLRRWVRWSRAWRPALGVVCCLWAELYAARHPVQQDENIEELDSWEVRALDASIRDLQMQDRLVVEMAWLAGREVEETSLWRAYERIAQGLVKRNVIL